MAFIFSPLANAMKRHTRIPDLDKKPRRRGLPQPHKAVAIGNSPVVLKGKKKRGVQLPDVVVQPATAEEIKYMVDNNLIPMDYVIEEGASLTESRVAAEQLNANPPPVKDVMPPPPPSPVIGGKKGKKS